MPELRQAIGEQRRVVVGLDRGGWSPALFSEMEAAGFDVLTWRKGTYDDVPEKHFCTVTHVDEHGETREWKAGDTTVELLISKTTGQNDAADQSHRPAH